MNEPTPATNLFLETVAETRFRGLFDLGLSKDSFDEDARRSSREMWTLEPGQSIGRYVLEKQMGEGGFGIVWMAEQTEPFKRQVALKLIKPGMDSRQVIARFEAERQTLALMEHPNIASVLDAGATPEGRPFFVMELVRGSPITAFCDERRLSVRQRLELFTNVCHGVQHAHQKAILHRDLKPSNILVEDVDTFPIPKIIDFGIAKALGAGAPTAGENTSGFTGVGGVIGTPEYMSPEQADSALDVDACSDIYSLGAILYELLTGKPPIQSRSGARMSLDRILRAIRETEPLRPSVAIADFSKDSPTRRIAERRDSEPRRLFHELRGDLDWIILKALEKDRRRRYESAAALAADIGRYLHHEPVVARPPTRLYLLQKLVRRNRAAFAAGGLVVVALLAGTALALWGLLLEREEKRRAEAAEDRAMAEAAKSRDVANFLGNVFQEISLRSDNLHVSGDALNANALHDLLDSADARRRRELQEDPQTDMRIARILGRAYAEIDDLDKAGSLYATAFGRLQQLNLLETADAADIMFWMAWTHHREFEERGYSSLEADDRNLLLRCLAIRQKTLAPDDEVLLQTEALLAGVLRSSGKPAEANVLLDRLLTGLNRERTSASPGYGWVLREKAILLHEQGKAAEAFANLDLAAKLLSKYASSQNRRFQVQADIARIQRTFYFQQGDFDAALRAAYEELDCRKIWLVNDDPRTLNAIAAIYLRLEQPNEAAGKLRLSINVSQKRHWYHAEEESLRMLVDNASLLYGPEAPERLQDTTALAKVILFDADQLGLAPGRSNKSRLDEAADLLRTPDSLREPYPFGAAEFFATRASLFARRQQYPAAVTELAKASLANPAERLYDFESAVYDVAAGNEPEYARTRDALLPHLAEADTSFVNFVWMSRTVLLRPGANENELDAIRSALLTRWTLRVSNPDDGEEAQEKPSNGDSELDESSNDWIGLLMGMVEYRAGNYDDAQNWLNSAQRSGNRVIALQREILSAMNEYRLDKSGAARAVGDAEVSFETEFSKYRATDSDVRLHDTLATRLLVEESKSLVSRSAR